jgi:peptidoglycan hydrolase CwlO-like protein
MPDESTLDKILRTVVSIQDDIKDNMATKTELAQAKADLTSEIEELATGVKKLTDELPFNRKRISRVEFHTKTLLGKKLDKTNAAFEEQYRGEDRMRQQEAGG